MSLLGFIFITAGNHMPVGVELNTPRDRDVQESI